jgi:hypothetical protein
MIGASKVNFGLANAAEEIPAYRYLRWYITSTKSSGNYMQASEFQFLNSSNSRIGLSNPSSEGSSPASEQNYHANDNNTSTKWLSLGFISSSVAWLKFDLGSGQTPITKGIKGYRWYTANDHAGRDPDYWVIQGSVDNSNWTTVHGPVSTSVTGNRNSLAYNAPTAFSNALGF